MPEDNKPVQEPTQPPAAEKKESSPTQPSFIKKLGTKWLILGALLLAVIVGIGAFLASQQKTATESGKTYKVGIVSGLDFFAGTIDGFKEGMNDLGYVEGENIVYLVEKTPTPVGNEAVIQKFVDDKVDLILTFPTEPSLEAKKVTEGTNVPVVFANAGLDGVKLVDSIRQPGGNITGVQFPTADNAVHRLEILHELAPKAKIIWIAYLKGYPIVPEELRRMRPAAAELGLTLIEVPVTSLDEIKADLEKREKATSLGIDAMLIIPEPITTSPEVYTYISNFAVKHRIPLGGAIFPFGVEGSLFGYTPDAVEVGKQAAVLADKIFKGTSAGTIPVVSSENYLVINYKVAQKLGLTVGEALLSRAKEIIR
jgi:putative tryptophan/tyrosine transport system substrate-binding protein